MREGAEDEREGDSSETPYHNIALCLLPTDHRLTSQQYNNKSACVTNNCKQEIATFITAGDLFLLYFSVHHFLITS